MILGWALCVCGGSCGECSLQQSAPTLAADLDHSTRSLGERSYLSDEEPRAGDALIVREPLINYEEPRAGDALIVKEPP